MARKSKMELENFQRLHFYIINVKIMGDYKKIFLMIEKEYWQQYEIRDPVIFAVKKLDEWGMIEEKNEAPISMKKIFWGSDKIDLINRFIKLKFPRFCSDILVTTRCCSTEQKCNPLVMYSTGESLGDEDDF